MKFESENFKFGAEAPVRDVKPGLKRQILCFDEDIMLVKVSFGPEMVGCRPPLHSHPHSQSSYVISGRFEFRCGDNDPVILGPGDAFRIGPGITHEAYCLEPGVIIDGFSPVREDFLP